MSAEPVMRVVVATDFSEGAERALMVAIRFAKLLGATIDLVHVYSLPLPIASAIADAPVPPPLPAPDDLADVRDRLDALAARVRGAGIECLTASSQGSAADEIVTHANRIGAELIVMGTHGRTGLRRVLLGSVAEKVLHKARCPVLVVPRAHDAAPGLLST